MLNEKPQVNHLPETFSRFSKSTKEAFSSFLSGDIFNYKKVRTKRRVYLPGCFYFYGQIVKINVAHDEAYLPGDFESFNVFLACRVH